MIGWELDLALDPNHELVRLATKIPWDDLTQEFGRLYVPELGRPGIPIRLMAWLYLLKHTYALSDEDVVKGWVENPYWQHFCGEVMFQHHFPINPSQMTRWRKRIGEKDVEKLLQATITAGKATGTITEQSFEKVIVDTTVQPKAAQHPTDARLYRKVHAAMLRIAGTEGIKLRQSYRKLMEWGVRKHGGYAKAKQLRRARKVLRNLKSMAGRVVRDVERKIDDAAFQKYKGTLILSELILTQKRTTRGKVGAGVIVAAQQGLQPVRTRGGVHCEGEGAQALRIRRQGVLDVAQVTHKEGFVVGAMSCPENPYDGHTLEGQLEQVERLTGLMPATTFVDRGYKGHGVDPGRSAVLISGTRKLTPPAIVFGLFRTSRARLDCLAFSCSPCLRKLQPKNSPKNGSTGRMGSP